MAFTEEQQRAIDTTGKNLLVAAAAGSGKTAVLVERILQHLLRGWNVSELLVVTFTRAAAAEMSERIGQRLQRAAEERRELLQQADVKQRSVLQQEIRHLEKQQILLPSADISTIDSFCQTVIRKNPERLDLDMRFRVPEEQESLLLRQSVLEDYLEECYEKEQPELLRLSEKYSTDKGDEQLYALLERLYAASQIQPQPERWLRSLETGLELQEGVRLHETCWWTPLWQRIELLLTELKELAQVVQENMGEVLAQLTGSRPDEKNRAAGGDYARLVCGNVARVSRAAAQGWDELRIALPSDWGRRPPFIKKLDPEHGGKIEAAVNELKNGFAKLENILLASEAELLSDVCLQRETVADLISLTLGFGACLAAKKREKNIIDFNDMEHFALAVLGEETEDGAFLPTEAALRLRKHYREVMVDEYQDTNKVQDTLFHLITGEEGKLFTVGDVKQSIYSFRAAEPSLFLERYHSYQLPAAEPRELVCLTKNFRSRTEVLEGVNFIFSQVMQAETLEIDYDDKARLNNGLNYGEPEEGTTLDTAVELLLVEKGAAAAAPVEVDGEETEEETEEGLQGFEAEARLVARRLKELKQSRVMVFDKDQDKSINNGYHEIRWRDMVVLLRSKSGKADVMLEALTAEDIPAYAEGSGGFFQATEIKMVLALLSVIDNLRQDIPLAAVLASPVVGLTVEELALLRLNLRDCLSARRAAGEKQPSSDDFAAAVLLGAEAEGTLPAELKQRLQSFLSRLQEWRHLSREVSVPELIWQLYRDTGYYDYVGGLPGGLLRQANLRMLVSRAEQYEKTDFRGLFRFLRFVGKLQDTDTDLSVARTLGEGEDVVRVMTIHKSKGLEFPVVVVADMGKGFNKKELRGDALIHKELGLGLKQIDPGRRIKYPSLPYLALREKKLQELRAEELRVLYVAMTRAREKLILSGSIDPLLTKKGEWSAQRQRWAKGAGAEGRLLPLPLLTKADSYFDWVVPAVARHPEAAKLHELLELDSPEPGLESCASSHWSVRQVEAGTVLNIVTERSGNEMLEAVQRGDALTGGTAEEKLLVAQVLAWQYDFHGTTEVPSKLSVSELKRRFAAEELAEQQSAVQLLCQQEQSDEKGPLPTGQTEPVQERTEEAQPFRRPSFLQGKKQMTGAEYGTLLHCVLQHVDLKGGLTAHGIRAQLERMIAQGIILQEEAGRVKLEHITNFYQSDLGRRLLAAREVWRELPFCRLVPAKRFYPQVTDEGAEIFSQGMIDLLFREEDGGLVLVDYKTDRGSNPEELRERYRLQLELYSEAVESITGERVKEKYLYLLRSGGSVKC